MFNYIINENMEVCRYLKSFSVAFVVYVLCSIIIYLPSYFYSSKMNNSEFLFVNTKLCLIFHFITLITFTIIKSHHHYRDFSYFWLFKLPIFIMVVGTTTVKAFRSIVVFNDVLYFMSLTIYTSAIHNYN